MDHLLIDRVWLFSATILVLSMQAGFLMLEAGRVRSKNTISVAQKNISDLTVSWTAFFLVGYWLMYGHGVPSPELTGDARSNDILRFLYQLGFCATAASIVSGAVAERMKFIAYLCLAAITASLIYPLAGRWVWSGLSGPFGAWLAEIGFVDFAGATVVHGVGGSVALAAACFIGPRHGRFDAKGQVRPMSGHSPVFSLLGVLILFVGWFGFNGGSISPSQDSFASVMLATASAGCFGALAGMVSGVWLDRGVFNPSRICSGLLGGLVAITAAVHVVTAAEAGAIGIVGGLIATLGADLLLHRFRIDDPVDAIATHGLAGLFGTLSFAFVGTADMLPAGGRLAQLGVQAIGASAVCIMAFAIAWCVLEIVSRFVSVKVGVEQQKLGLNSTEHGEAIGTDRVTRALEDQLITDSALPTTLNIEGDGDTEELAAAMNRLLDRHEEARKVISASQTRFEQFARTASDWLWETDENLFLTHLSVETDTVAGAELHSMRSMPLHGLLRWADKESESIRLSIANRQALEINEAVLFLPGGDQRLVEVRGVPFKDDAGAFAGYRGTFQDVTERRSAERRAVYLSRHDTLTGLANRRALITDLEEAMALGSVAIAAVDLDGFKAVNDAYGHQAGDELLALVAKRLKGSLKKAGTAYRTGGDEFVLVLAGVDVVPGLQQLVEGCTRLVQRLSSPYEIGGQLVTLGASVGLAIAPDHSAQSDELMHLADLALYVAKSDGKGCVRVFDEHMNKEARDKVAMETALRKALANDEFTVHYQPQFDTHGQSITGFEALLRWRSADLGQVPPAEFIYMAERLGLIGSIGEFVLRSACQFAAKWPQVNASFQYKIAVNVSHHQFENPGFVDQVRSILKSSALQPERLELEVPENMLMSNVVAVRDSLDSLRAMGISIAINDFGMGQSSLRYLNKLPIDKLKIDRCFVRGLLDDTKAHEVAHSIVMLGHKLGYTVTAEGIEHAQQASLLQSWKCDQLQGFLYAKPLSEAQILKMLTENSDADDSDDTSMRSNAA